MSLWYFSGTSESKAAPCFCSGAPREPPRIPDCPGFTSLQTPGCPMRTQPWFQSCTGSAGHVDNTVPGCHLRKCQRSCRDESLSGTNGRHKASLQGPEQRLPHTFARRRRDCVHAELPIPARSAGGPANHTLQGLLTLEHCSLNSQGFLKSLSSRGKQDLIDRAHLWYK